MADTNGKEIDNMSDWKTCKHSEADMEGVWCTNKHGDKYGRCVAYFDGRCSHYERENDTIENNIIKNNIGQYESPFESRYGSNEMRGLFSPLRKYATWRTLWVMLARGEKSLGLDITGTQIDEMEEHLLDIPFDRVAEIERETHHDVMAHIRAYAEQCPQAAPIIHLGATSAFVVDNTDVIIMHEAISMIIERISVLWDVLYRKMDQYKDTPILAYTHFQPAQPTTFGKRVSMWGQDLNDDYERLLTEMHNMKILGCKGATGTCASFLELFNGDYDKVRELDKFVAKSVEIDSVGVSGQTYSRKQDYYIFSVLSGIAQTLSKIANDIRLMSSKGEFFEPFGDRQVGSSAMAYKRNPIKCEKVVSLARLVINNATAIANTAANQWLERSLDDSAIRRVLIPETFLAVDEMLFTMTNIMECGVVQEDVMLNNLKAEIPKMVSEGVLMLAVKKGGDRQELHEIIRQYTLLANPEHFIQLICEDKRFNLSIDEVLELTNIKKLVGAAPIQVDDFKWR
jgi:adenylosuccinate lyase